MKPSTVYYFSVEDDVNIYEFTFDTLAELREARIDVEMTHGIMVENRTRRVDPNTIKMWKVQTSNLSVGDSMAIAGIDNNCLKSHQRELIRSGKYNSYNDNSGMCLCLKCIKS